MKAPQAAEAQREPPGLAMFGGTFNPIHLGHLRAAEEAAELLGLEKVLFVPSADPPHKTEAQEPLAPAPRRLAWVKASIADNPRFEVDALELERSGPSYSVDTLRVIGARTAPARPVFVIGDEAFAELGTWREPERVLELAHFAVLRRPGAVLRGTLGDWLPRRLARELELESGGQYGRHRRAGTWLRVVAITGLDVSATGIRARLREGRSIRYLVPEAIRREIVASGCYAAGGED